MAHITLSIPDSVYEEMKKRPEIKWSEIARASIMGYLKSTKGKTTSAELLGMLNPETRAALKSIPPSRAKALYKRMVKEEWKEHKSLTRA